MLSPGTDGYSMAAEYRAAAMSDTLRRYEAAVAHFERKENFLLIADAITTNDTEARSAMLSRVRALVESGELDPIRNAEHALGTPARWPYVLGLFDSRAERYLALANCHEDRDAYRNLLEGLMVITWGEFLGDQWSIPASEAGQDQMEELHRRANYWNRERIARLAPEFVGLLSGPQQPKEAPGQPLTNSAPIGRYLLKKHRERHGVSNKELAGDLGFCERVLYAISAGTALRDGRCGPDKVESVAKMLGCLPEALDPLYRSRLPETRDNASLTGLPEQKLAFKKLTSAP